MLKTSVLSVLVVCSAAFAEPVLLDDQFKLPPGFHIYKVAEASLTGGSYDITFDGEGRLLVGDGKAVRRLTDTNGDHVYDQQEVIAEGLGGRGPQGLLVFGDKLYAVGGDGIQLFSGYRSGGPLKHEGRLGQPFNTGGDHSAHTVLRGLDGYIYFVCGDGGGVGDRKHITEESSPVIYERNGSVFRFDPDGEYWECISAGGRNAPSLGMNYLGEFFSFDSDMEWHVDLPWYRPVRLNHWAIGGDQGWQGVGAYPPYYIDNLPPVLKVGRGSPNWGIFYEHNQLPAKYQDSFLCCDYRWKSATSGGYNSSGRLVAFHLTRAGATWHATMETLAETIPNAKDEQGRGINFALVDVDVAPDGSLFVSDHNQGVWRIFYSATDAVPPILPRNEPIPRELAKLQPGSEWTRLRLAQRMEERGGLGDLNQEGTLGNRIQSMALGGELRDRHTAIRLLAPKFRVLSKHFLTKLAADSEPEIRAQAAWLYGIRRNAEEAADLIELLADQDPFVRRRAAEALGRLGAADASEALVQRMGDEMRPVRYAAMTALAHRPSEEWMHFAQESNSPQVWMRGLVAASIRREKLDQDVVTLVVNRLLDAELTSKEDQLDLLRVLGMFRHQFHESALGRVSRLVVTGLQAADADIRWECARLVGDYGISQAITPMIDRLVLAETEDVTRFHFAQALSKVEHGWDEGQRQRFFDWLVTTQEGWFAEFEGKGRQFPQFWATVLDRIVDGHPETVARYASTLKPGSQLSGLAYGVLASTEPGQRQLREMLATGTPVVRRAIVDAMSKHGVDEAFWPVLLKELSTPEARRALADWIGRQGASADQLADAMQTLEADGMSGEQLVAFRLLSLLGEGREARRAARALDILYGEKTAEQNLRQADVRVALQERWQAWYRERFGVPFAPAAWTNTQELLTSQQVHQLVLDANTAGNVGRGRSVYLQAQCFSCHGGLQDKQAAVFGPDLVGVTKRLKPDELADAIVYPSKQVAERFRPTTVATTDGDVYTGVLTERTDKRLVLVTLENKIIRIPAADVDEVGMPETSFMPEKLLNRFSEAQVKDLMAFLRSLK